LRGWPTALFAATGVSAVFAFGLIPTAFAAQAQALFLVFATALLLFAISGALFGARRRFKRKHAGEQGIAFTGKLTGAITMASALLAIVFFWTDNDLSGEKIGRSLDHGAATLGRQIEFALNRINDARCERSRRTTIPFRRLIKIGPGLFLNKEPGPIAHVPSIPIAPEEGFPMLGWAIGFFVAAIVAGVFGFGGIATAFTGIAIIMFWVFLALFALSLVFNTFGGAHASTHSGSGRTFATVALIAGVALLVYAWVDNDMSAERVGREIDQTAVQVAEGTSDALGEAGDRAENVVDDAADEVEEDVDQATDEDPNT
jgi:uncharacterized membrane protein YtjA (UPF0391 family)